jgi:hypothetical protein
MDVNDRHNHAVLSASSIFNRAHSLRAAAVAALILANVAFRSRARGTTSEVRPEREIITRIASLDKTRAG